jgi:peroxiredoxin
MKHFLLFLGVAVLGLLSGMLVTQWRNQDPAPEASPAATNMIGQHRPPYTLGAMDGRRVSAAEFDGQVVLVNFWATWCAPCREEMPMLQQVQERFDGQGLQVVGIALDDVARAREFAEKLGISYTILVGSADVMATGVIYGNQAGMLPYSVLVDRDGVISWTWLGELDPDELALRVGELL